MSEIANIFISAGICRNRKVFDDLFDVFETNVEEGFISFEQFLVTIESCVLSRRLFVNSLDSFIIDDDSLSVDTIISQERRKLLMQHVVDRPAVRAWGIEHSSDLSHTSSQRRQYRNIKMQSISELTKRYAKERADTAEVVFQLEDILQEEQNRSKSPSHPKATSKPLPVLLPLEQLLSEDLLASVDTSLERLSFDLSGNIMKSPKTLLTSPSHIESLNTTHLSTPSSLLPAISPKNKISRLQSIESEDVSEQYVYNCMHISSESVLTF